jgi:excisionase family DNA binding protein
MATPIRRRDDPGGSISGMSSAVRQTTKELDVTLATERLLLRPEEVAGILGVGRTKVFELIRTGELRSIKLGRSRRVSTEAVASYVRRLDNDS